ncbi:MAG: histidinol dehydrogenase [Candidatus Nasuia deltocephalinicola]
MWANNLVKLDSNNKNLYNIINVINNFRINNDFINLENYVKNIIYNINIFKEKSIEFYTKKFEKYYDLNKIKINQKELENNFYSLDIEERYLLELSKNRIEIFHNEQKKNYGNNWKLIEDNGTILGQKGNKIEKIGCYIPGGKNVYPSSIFMNIIPAKISGIENITTCFPGKKNNKIILASIFLCGIKNVFSIGGIPAIISMAYGNKIIEKVDKICGPGNIYVTLSKKIINGICGIDIIAGPSEVLIFADNYSNINEVIMDLLSQSEHDKLSQSIIISKDEKFLIKLEKKIKNFIPFLYRKEIVYNSIFNNILIIKIKNFNEAFNIINYISPEHLILNLKNNFEFFKNIKNSGSNFINKYTSESFGDYTSGLNHIIPTNKNCKFSSPLGIKDFNKNLNFLKLSKLGFNKLYNTTLKFSKKEKLFSHFESVKYRI